MFSSLPYFAPKLFCFLVTRLLMSSCILDLLASRIFSLFWNVFFCLYRFILSRYLFSLSSFASTFWFISSSCIVYFACYVAFLFSSKHIPAFFLCLIIFTCCRRFLFCVSSLISHPDFVFLFMFFWETPILLQTNFVSAYVSSFNSVMLFPEIFVNNFKFLPCLFSSLCFLTMVMYSSFQT